jgi:hypothetical protein
MSTEVIILYNPNLINLMFSDRASQYNLVSFKNLMHNSFSIIIHYIKFLYMFPASPCSSSGGLIVLLPPLVSPFSVTDRTVHRLTATLTHRTVTDRTVHRLTATLNHCTVTDRTVHRLTATLTHCTVTDRTVHRLTATLNHRTV